MLRALITCCLASLLGIVGPSSLAVADERGETQQQLAAARADVAELKKRLGSLQQETSAAQKALRGTETELGQLQKQIDDLHQQLRDSEQEIQRLAQEKARLQDARHEQQWLIGIQARAAYQSGRQEYLKLLLNQQQPEQFSRTLTYYDYLSQARLEQLGVFNETLRQLDNVEAAINLQQAQLLVQTSSLDQQREQLAQVRKDRQLALATLKQDYSARDKKLQAREQEQAQLGRVLKTIEATLARQAREARAAQQAARAEQARQQALAEQRNKASGKPSADADKATSGPLVSSASTAYGGPFAKARGKLPWPVDGRLMARFGTPRGDDARTKWDGVLIAAAAGSQVRAIHAGRVVFADWLRGAGLLVILDHGNGYLSLYGHNQSLLKKAGERVKAGESIATVGTSGGQDTPALYFAIRQQGRPSDPVQWCSAQG
jgi:septal ring factor EnvC (AmiA/AmiB activator)